MGCLASVAVVRKDHLKTARWDIGIGAVLTQLIMLAVVIATADHPEIGGRCKRKKMKVRPKKRSMEVRLPSSSAVHVGGRPSRCFWRFGF
jgi:hypothetical protein